MSISLEKADAIFREHYAKPMAFNFNTDFRYSRTPNDSILPKRRPRRKVKR